MTTKPYRYSWIVLLAFLVACGKQTVALPTKTPVPTTVSPTLVPTSTFIPVTVTPSPLPTGPVVPIITPDTIQVGKWREYQDALAKNLLSFLPSEEVLCEWEILGRSVQDVYVWAVCMSINPFNTTSEGRDIFSSSSTPAVIHVEINGNVQGVEVPGPGTTDYQRMFPTYLQGRFEYYRFEGVRKMLEHIDLRRKNLEEPPLIVLSATPMP